LLKVAKNEQGYEMAVIRKFPKDLQQKLDKCKVEYTTRKDEGKQLEIYDQEFSDWADEKGLVLSTHGEGPHIFKAECFTVYIDIECYVEKNKFDEMYN